MKAQRLTKALLNTPALPLPIFLAPSLHLPIRIASTAPFHISQHRHISTTKCLHAIIPPGAETPSKPADLESAQPNPPKKAPQRVNASLKRGDTTPKTPEPEIPKAPEIRQQIDPEMLGPISSPSASTFGTPNNLKRRNQPTFNQQQIDAVFNTLHQKPRLGASNSTSGGGLPRSSSQLLLDRFAQSQQQQQQQLPGQTPLQTLRSTTASRQDQIAKVAALSNMIASRQSTHLRRNPPKRMRVDAYMGRAVAINHKVGMNFGKAMSMLLRMQKENNIRGEWHQQRFHERKGLKRKRLRSERWRARFKDGFYNMLQKVRKMKGQGW